MRVNNLKGIDLEIPHGQWLSICGLSGSGKTSLALDTLYAEGQRRYIESLSPYARQFLGQLEKPLADRIDGMPPAIAVKAVRGKAKPLTTVGSATEIVDHLQWLFAKAATAWCPNCDRSIDRSSPQSVARKIASFDAGTRIQIAFELDLNDQPIPILDQARRNGFNRVLIGGSTIEISSALLDRPQMLAANETGFVIVDRLKAESPVSRICDSVETAFRFAKSADDSNRSRHCVVFSEQATGERVLQIDGKPWSQATFSEDLICSHCGFEIAEISPHQFNYRHPLGACAGCGGTGQTTRDGKQMRCPECSGGRVGKVANAFRFGQIKFGDMQTTQINRLFQFFEDDFWELLAPHADDAVVKRLVNTVSRRLGYLCQVGLGHLTLSRAVESLSGGESQRVSMTTCLASTLVNMFYVLDEPSLGLHPHDLTKLRTAIKSLHRRGNTVVVVDHEESMIRSAERVIEIGPAAGESGGEIVFDGTLAELEEADSLTGDYLAGRRGLSIGTGERRQPRGRIKLMGASGHNLNDVNAEFPLGVLCVVTGVSGAGKSSLVQQTLYGALCQKREIPCQPPLPFKQLFGGDSIDEIVLIDQSPIGRSARSNPVTYIKAYDEIRKIFAETAVASANGLKAGHFSFNVAGGRCEKCEGNGVQRIDMQFLADVVMTCDQCRGKRFRDDVLAARYRGKDVSEVLDLTVREAFSFFRGQPKTQAKLKNLIDVGLEYIRLGQPATRLSTGEAQRLKLAQFLNANRKGRSLFIMDEPTSGLHMNDVVRLMDCFNALLDVGHSMIIVEHNLQVIKNSDWIIDLGPGAADEGGTVVAAGTPETVADNEDSITGQFLKPLLELVTDE